MLYSYFMDRSSFLEGQKISTVSLRNTDDISVMFFDYPTTVIAALINS